MADPSVSSRSLRLPDGPSGRAVPCQDAGFIASGRPARDQEVYNAPRHLFTDARGDAAVARTMTGRSESELMTLLKPVLLADEQVAIMADGTFSPIDYHDSLT